MSGPVRQVAALDAHGVSPKLAEIQSDYGITPDDEDLEEMPHPHHPY